VHLAVEPSILYFGTPVVLVSTLNEDSTPNLAPFSSAFWLGWRCLLGMATSSKTAGNLARTRQCAVNLPCAAQVAEVNRLALTTGLSPVPPHKEARGYRYRPDKFGAAGMTPVPSETIGPPRAAECPVHLECVLETAHPVAGDDERLSGRISCFELRVQRVHVDDSLLAHDDPDRIDPDKWRPLIMSFQRFYGLGAELADSRLASIPERMYRSPDIERARASRAVAHRSG